MIYSEARQGRVLVIRLEHGEVLNETIERFAEARGIHAATLIVLGGADGNSRLVVGPENGDARPVKPMERILEAAHEIAGVGTLFRDDTGKPVLHAHVAAGRRGATTTGCTRAGLVTWQVAEIVLFELVDTSARRLLDPELGFKLLCP